MSPLAKYHSGSPGAPEAGRHEGRLFPQTPWKEPARPTPGSQLSSVQDCGRRDLCCLGRPVVVLCCGSRDTHVTVSSGPEGPPGPAWGTLLKHAKGPPSLCLFSSCLCSVFGLWSLHILISHPCSLHLGVQRSGSQREGHLGNNYTAGLQVDIPVLHRKLGKGIPSPPEVPSPSSSLEPPHFTITLR